MSTYIDPEFDEPDGQKLRLLRQRHRAVAMATANVWRGNRRRSRYWMGVYQRTDAKLRKFNGHISGEILSAQSQQVGDENAG